MCGRARLATDYSEIKIQLSLDDFVAAPNWRPSWNIAPTQDIFVVTRESDPPIRTPRIMRWGLIPSWSKDAKPKFPSFNARAEAIDQTAMFRDSWRAGRRCLVVTDGFYEWRKSDKQPFAVARSDGKLMVMAGLWERWRGREGETIRSCTVITTAANAATAPVHDRMPVILAPEAWPAWLGEAGASAAELKALLKPCPDEAVRLWPVDRRVGNVKNDDAGLVEAAQAPEPGSPLLV